MRSSILGPFKFNNYLKKAGLCPLAGKKSEKWICALYKENIEYCVCSMQLFQLFMTGNVKIHPLEYVGIYNSESQNFGHVTFVQSTTDIVLTKINGNCWKIFRVLSTCKYTTNKNKSFDQIKNNSLNTQKVLLSLLISLTNFDFNCYLSNQLK